MEKGTYHQYYKDCDEDIKTLFEIKNMELCPDGYEPVHSMNEYYVSTFEAKGSDEVFEKMHVDGPFGFMPFQLLRCIVVLEPNSRVITNIPSQDFSRALKREEHVMFDYNRDLHYIFIADGEETSPRVVLKLHYVRKQDYYKLFVLLCVIWNTFARFIFIASKNPVTWYQKATAFVINRTTEVVAKFNALGSKYKL